MKTKYRVLLPVALGLVFLVCGCVNLDRPRIVCQPQTQLVPAGANAVFEVVAEKLPPYQCEPITYQWQFNPGPVIGKKSPAWTNITGALTNSPTFVVTNVGTNGLGFYRVKIGMPAVISEPAALLSWTTNSPITVYGTPQKKITSSGGTCPGPYWGYVNFKKPDPAWGWSCTVTSPHVAEDIVRTDTKTQIAGMYGDGACGSVSASMAGTCMSPKYRFTIYFPTAQGTNAYPIRLTNYDP